MHQQSFDRLLVLPRNAATAQSTPVALVRIETEGVIGRPQVVVPVLFAQRIDQRFRSSRRRFGSPLQPTQELGN